MHNREKGNEMPKKHGKIGVTPAHLTTEEEKRMVSRKRALAKNCAAMPKKLQCRTYWSTESLESGSQESDWEATDGCVHRYCKEVGRMKLQKAVTKTFRKLSEKRKIVPQREK